MASLIFYQNAVCGVTAEADAADFSLTSNDKLFYHFNVHDGGNFVWDNIFANVQYDYIQNAQTGQTQEGAGVSGASQLHRWKYHAGAANFAMDDLTEPVRILTNWFMMNAETAAVPSDPLDSTSDAKYVDVANTVADPEGSDSGHCQLCTEGTPGPALVVANVIDEAEADGNFLIPTATWANMLNDPTGRLTAVQYDLIIDHFGSKGRLAHPQPASQPALVSTNLRLPLNAPTAAKTRLAIAITYEVGIIITDEHGRYEGGTMLGGDETLPAVVAGNVGLGVAGSDDDGVNIATDIGAGTPGTAIPNGDEYLLFPAKKFQFIKGQATNGKNPAAASDSDLDASGATKLGLSNRMRFRKFYRVENL